MEHTDFETYAAGYRAAVLDSLNLFIDLFEKMQKRCEELPPPLVVEAYREMLEELREQRIQQDALRDLDSEEVH